MEEPAATQSIDFLQIASAEFVLLWIASTLVFLMRNKSRMLELFLLWLVLPFFGMILGGGVLSEGGGRDFNETVSAQIATGGVAIVWLFITFVFLREMILSARLIVGSKQATQYLQIKSGVQTSGWRDFQLTTHYNWIAINAQSRGQEKGGCRTARSRVCRLSSNYPLDWDETKGFLIWSKRCGLMSNLIGSGIR